MTFLNRNENGGLTTIMQVMFAVPFCVVLGVIVFVGLLGWVRRLAH